MNPAEVWNTALDELQYKMTKATFDTWVRGTHALGMDNGTMVVGVHSPYAKEWLENRLHTTIERTVTGILGRSVEVRYVVKEKSNGHAREIEEIPIVDLNENELEIREPEPSPAQIRADEHMARSLIPLTAKYTFDSFIVGNSNRLAHAAAQAVAENPGQSYNPLFIYGGTGLGKTHLLHALGQVPQAKGKRVMYISSETFTNDLINSIRSQTMPEFRGLYREIDVLLIDDIQFIAGKESTQEEFFHTFNHLFAANKQIVLCSDRHPRAITTLEDRLRSRFEGGMITDIQPPDLELRIAILRAKAETQTITVPDDVIDQIAHKVQSNIRELEGALTRVVGYARLMHLPLSVEMTNTVLRDIFQRQPLTSDQVLAAVAEVYRVEIEDLTGRSRNKEVVLPRQVAMYLLREETGASLPQIGDLLGGRDHTTVIYSHDKISQQIETEDKLRREILAIKERLYQQQPA
ncbi:MAG: chromosomal replication initiator protein DnaA [Chloroflexi bacterium]|nr:chromosomal replication initiator protein DnaA [Chloroflexota bacterium]